MVVSKKTDVKGFDCSGPRYLGEEPLAPQLQGLHQPNPVALEWKIFPKLLRLEEICSKNGP